MNMSIGVVNIGEGKNVAVATHAKNSSFIARRELNDHGRPFSQGVWWGGNAFP